MADLGIRPECRDRRDPADRRTDPLHRKAVLVALVALFVLGNLLSALAPELRVALLGRSSPPCATAPSSASARSSPAGMVPPERASQAVAVMFAGLTIANVLGVPFGALVGEHWGWRATFWAITGIGVLALAGIAVLVPAWAGAVHEAHRPAGLRPQLRAFRSWQVWLTLAATALSYGGMFGAFSYIAYTFTEVTGFTTADVAWLLIVYGVGLVIGNLARRPGGRPQPRPHADPVLAGLAVTLAVFGLLADERLASVVLVFLMGVSGSPASPA